MNKACLSCGRIITVPDIPLPKDFTQKCEACGFENSISDEFTNGAPAPQPAKRKNSPQHKGARGDLWDSTLDHSMDDFILGSSQSFSDSSFNKTQEELFWKFDQRFRELEANLRRELAANSGGQAMPQGNGGGIRNGNPIGYYEAQLAKNVQLKEVYLGTQNLSLARKYQGLLQKDGFKVQTGQSLKDAWNALQTQHFHILIFDQNFLQSGDLGKQILKHLKHTPLIVRRCQIVVLISPGIPTCESQVFYQWGIDLNIHPKDLDSLPDHLRDLEMLKRQMLAPYLFGLTTSA